MNPTAGGGGGRGVGYDAKELLNTASDPIGIAYKLGTQFCRIKGCGGAGNH